jgi:hypothetical protein
VEDVDILKNMITASKKVLKSGARTKAVNAESAFEAIAEAKHELRDEIAKARRLSQT